MKIEFEQKLDHVPNEVSSLFAHKLRNCPVEEAYDVLFCAGFGDQFTMADVVAYKQSLLPPPAPIVPAIVESPPPTVSPAPSHPKYYLADVPQELRLQLIDLCFRQRRHEALTLLREKGFYQYDDVDLQAFYGWAPTNLPEPIAPPPLSSVRPSLNAPPVAPASTESAAPAMKIDHPEACAEQPVSSIQNPESDAHDPEPDPDDSKASAQPASADTLPKRRGKVARLPKEIRMQVNLFIDEGKPYEEIIQWLEEKGFPGFNSVNLHNWKDGGFQDWLREQERLESQQLQREWITDLIKESAPGEANHLTLQLFSSQIMDTLFGLDTRDLKKGLGSNPRHYIALLNSVCRMNEHLTDSEEYQEFIRHYRERKNRKNAGLSDEARELIMNELRIFVRNPAPRQSSETPTRKSGREP